MDSRPINEQIRESKLIVITSDGTKLGEMTRQEALNKANEADLDLVLIAPGSENRSGVAKIIDYGKFLYELKAKEKASKKNQSVSKTKEIKVRPQIGIHDLTWRAKNAIEWLKEGNVVKFKIQAFGRIGTKQEIIEETYNKFVELIGDAGKVITPLKKLSPVLYEASIVKNK
ncbi:MAG: translation initiation factor IF-3 [Mycoplasmataceae bacterium]|nr:translation initiation factor IF-3 [Mycoplasmataceae bacterium]